ncbi:M20 peptidase aminoacylase family protein [Bacillus sp. UNC438CL73TsuS30]|uniref:M20 peptidase aminoacylase family protein n=1 Tax=Bacillus sp. UNC438CL73TsuS30 TaxID=1340434 RepID=UPI00047A67BC|nr:M20 peptidase aminoacylase family protein [Bacillus sp. UNC438CL73TsuS30]
MRAELDELRPMLLEVFDHLHRNPEASWEEVETTAYINNLLQQHGFEPQTFEDCTGLVVEVGDGPRKVGLRTDIDALWQEVDGTFQANHSCGHDAHMTMIIGTMLLLKKLNYQPSGKLKVLFQPAEEKGTGALKMVEKGLVDDLDFLYGVHLRPIQEIPDGTATPAIFHGAGKFITGEIIGEDAHGARPHLGKNAIEIGAALINEMAKIHVDPMVPSSVKMTKFHAGGESSNIIPGYASFHLDLRAQTNEVMKALTAKVEKIAEAISILYDVKIALETKANISAAKVDPQAQQLMEKAIIETLGKATAPYPTSGGEDFHFYTVKQPNIKATMLGLGCGLSPGLHHPKMTFNHESLFTGIEILTKTIMNTFEHLKKEAPQTHEQHC